MSGPGQPVASLQGVSLRYGATTALARVDLEIPSGSLVGLIGPDGAGKSSLLALVAGARRIQEGSVRALGGDMGDARHRTDACARIAYMPQGLGRNLYATLSVRENLDFFGRLFGQSRSEREERIGELLASTGLAPFAERAAGKLSGGMKQKLGISCALLHDPDLVILDEPTTGVDPLSRRQFWELVARLRARRPELSVVVATAYMEEAEQFDWLVAMDAGVVLAAGRPAEIEARTGTRTLEEAFVALLPAEKRRGHEPLVVAPRRSEPGATPAIEAHGLTRRFGDFVAVDHVSFTIERGEIFAFVGSNGCGKTTTMKMLTGLLPATEGTAEIFGRPVEAASVETRKRVGFMSQSFSLYSELTVRQNLVLHAHVFQLPRERVAARVAELAREFDLEWALDAAAQALPLGVRQRLSLAVAVIHEPELLILDEPTSGVDPVARDRFWKLLVGLSREKGVTIFVSTHFMNEAERCDRVSLMHAGRVLAEGSAAELTGAVGAATLDEAFVRYLEREAPAPLRSELGASPLDSPGVARGERRGAGFSPARAWAYVRRETMELLRDPIRLTFAVLGPPLLMLLFGYGLTFDVENIPFAVLDQDRTPESRDYRESFSSSRYFTERAPIPDEDAIERRLQGGEILFALEIPPGFGDHVKTGRRPEVALWLDGSNHVRAETSRGYVEALHAGYLAQAARGRGVALGPGPAGVEVRFRYNQDFKSLYAMVPGVMMLMLAFIPAMLTALGAVREKELGSITNLYVTPVTRLEFLVGKQIPYIALALLNGATLVALAILLFGVPFKGSPVALALGTLLYVCATTGFGMFISTFVRSQTAAIFAAGFLVTLPAIQFSGLLVPVSSLSPDARIIGAAFPSSHFQHIAVGTFTKALDLPDVARDLVALAALAVFFLALSRAFLRKQET